MKTEEVKDILSAPWEVSVDGIVDADGDTVVDRSSDIDDSRWHGTLGPLVGAAPDLLEALKRVTELLGPGYAEAQDAARSAIAKAEGR